MTVSLVQIRQNLRRALFGRERRRVPAGAVRAELLENRQLLSAGTKRTYDSVRAEETAHHHTANDGHDHRLHIDGLPLAGGTAGAGSTPQGAAPFDLGQTFQLSSLPSASKTIYLDFNGHTTSGTWWNSSYNGGAAFTTPAFSVDGTAAFSDAELERIQRIWQRVAEDFAPFNVNVTTQDPGTAGITKSGTGDTTWGVRVVIGGGYQDWFKSSAGGVAYLNTFGASIDQGVFVFSNSLSNGEKNVAEAISHEAGHALGLSHDGASGVGYYQGHGSGATGWAPIMGVGYYRELTQWSKGQYPGANNTQDDLAIITNNTNGFGYRNDDYGSTQGTASVLASTTSGGVKTVSASGIIERNTDQDWFSFTTTGGAVDLSFTGAYATNLDILASLYNSSGQLVLSSDPIELTTASLSTTLAAGTYYVMVDGVGARTLTDGYSDYGSLGQYFITGTIADGSGDGGGGDSDPPPQPPASGTASISGRIWHDADGDGRVDVGDGNLAGVQVYIDVNNNGLLDSGEQSTVTGADGMYSLTGLAAGTYRIRQTPGTGYQQVYPKANAARSVSVSTGRAVANIDFRSLQTAVFGNLGSSLTYLPRTAATAVAPRATVTDPDTQVFTNFKLTAQITSGGNSADRLSVLNQGRGAGQVGVSGSAVYYSGVRVGSVSGGSGTGKLTITFNASASSAAVQAVFRCIAYRSTASTPAAGAKTVQFLMTESNGTISLPATKQILI